MLSPVRLASSGQRRLAAELGDVLEQRQRPVDRLDAGALPIGVLSHVWSYVWRPAGAGLPDLLVQDRDHVGHRPGSLELAGVGHLLSGWAQKSAGDPPSQGKF